MKTFILAVFTTAMVLCFIGAKAQSGYIIKYAKEMGARYMVKVTMLKPDIDTKKERVSVSPGRIFDGISRIAKTPNNSMMQTVSGQNCISWINASSGFRFTVNSNSAKTVKFSMKYRADGRGGILKVNGTQQNVNFPTTNWNWGTKDVQVQLRQGANSIEFYGGYQTQYAPDIAEITVTW
jgi:hypothetical protein